jgi:hypothetical protein
VRALVSLVVAAVLVALLAAGCTDDSAPEPAPTPSAGTTRGAGETDPPAPARTEDEVVERVRAGVVAARDEEPIPGATAPSVVRLKGDYARGAGCPAFYRSDGAWELCGRGADDGDRTLVVIGDSHARQWGSPIDILAERAGYTAYHLVRLGCPAADITPWLNKGDGPNLVCEDFHAWTVEQVRALRPDVVVLATSFNPNGYYVAGEQVLDEAERLDLLREAMVRLVQQLEPDVGRFVVIGDPPAVQLSPAKCLVRPRATLGDCAAYGADLSIKAIDTVRRAADAVGATYISTEPWFCLNSYCPTVLGELLPYRDQNHVSDTYARYLTEVIGRRLALDSVR